MTTVNQLLDGKGHEVITVSPEDSVFQALQVMAQRNVGALPVVDGGKLVGMLSERDYARNVILQGKASSTTEVGEIMTKRVVCVSPEQTVEECMALMTDKQFRHLPVVSGEDLVGLISIGDLVKSIIADQKFIIDQLANYISSG